MKTVSSVLSTVILFLLTIGCAPSQDRFGSLKGEGPKVRKDLVLDDFSGIELSMGNTEIILRQGDVRSVSIEAQQNIIDNLNQEVRSGVWDVKIRRNTRGFAPIRIWVTLPSLEVLRLSGSGHIRSEGTFRTESSLRLSVTGSGDIDLKVEADRVNAGISGSGSIRLEGTAREAELGITGSGGLGLRNLALKSCEVGIVGSGDAAVWVEELLSVSITGSGGVTYRGTPSIRSNITGSGELAPE